MSAYYAVLMIGSSRLATYSDEGQLCVGAGVESLSLRG